MSDWQTVRQQILEELDRPNDSEIADRALAEALEFCQKNCFWFNQGTWELYLKTDVDVYDLPSHVLSVVGGVYLTKSGSDNSRRQMQYKSIDWISTFRDAGSDADDWSEINICRLSGPPAFYSLGSDKIYVARRPSADGDKVDGRCILGFGVPEVRYAPETGWQVCESKTGKLIPPTYTSPWFTVGRKMLRARAKMIIADQYIGDATALATASQQFAEEMIHLRQETVRKAGPRSVRGHLT